MSLPITAEARCRQALVLGLDVSSSVDETEYRLQFNGLALALQDAEVASLLLAQPNAPIQIAVFEWSGRDQQRLIVDWLPLVDASDINRLAAILYQQSRSKGTHPTAIGHALKYAGQLIRTGPSCWQKTVDISGDGKNNDGFRPSAATRSTVFENVTVNGLVIGTDAPPGDQISGNEMAELTSYYRQEVIFGPNAFIETAIGFEGFEAAMKRKLLRELAVVVASSN